MEIKVVAASARASLSLTGEILGQLNLWPGHTPRLTGDAEGELKPSRAIAAYMCATAAAREIMVRDHEILAGLAKL